MAKCYQCGNGFGFRGKKSNKNDIKKTIKEIMKAAQVYADSFPVADKSEYFKRQLQTFKQSKDKNILLQKLSDDDLVCEKCVILYLHGNYAVPISHYNKIRLTEKQRFEFIDKYPEFHDKWEKQLKDIGDQMPLNKSKVENNDDSEFSHVCYWCKNNFKETHVQIIKYGYGADFTDGVECSKCKDIRKGLYSDKLGSLIREYSHKKSKAENLRELERKAYRAKVDASNRAEFDGWVGDRTDKITTQNHYDDLVMQSDDNVSALSDIPSNITKEMKRLAEEHFFKNKSNNVEEKDNSKTETPLEILIVLLAIGEITIEEFNKIKENLD